MHGGKTLKGIAHPSFKTGIFSAHLPSRMLPDYEHTKDDPRRLDLEEEIALIRARAVDLIRRVDTGESGNLWKLLQAAYRDLQLAKTGPEQLEAIAVLGNLITRGAADYAAWEEASKQIDRTQRLVESQRKREEELQHNMPVDQLKWVLQALMEAIVKYVSDRDTRASIQAEFNRVVYLTGQQESAA